jgi:DNA replication ATP-dependent helicase Dna2
MHTADRFQGRDKEVIILSLVRSNEAKSIGELLKDWRRINVAFTRAKTKLLVVGSRETLKGKGPDANGEEEMVARFVKVMEEKEWIFDLPKTALEDHLFEDGQTQVTSTGASRPPGTQWMAIKQEYVKEKVKGIMMDKEGQENVVSVAGGKAKGPKKICGNKPFKIPTMGVLQDVVNEALG